MLLLHCNRLAALRAALMAGSNRPIRIPMIVMTTSSSMSVNPRREMGATARGLQGMAVLLEGSSVLAARLPLGERRR
jgi:hypothetical protein